VCPYCKAKVAVPASQTVIEELDYQLYASGLPEQEAGQEQLTVTCSACGAETHLGPNVTANRCVFCGSAVVANQQSRRTIKPRALLPFAVARQKAQEDFSAWLGSLWFAPSDLKKRATTASSGLFGVYVPCWTFDADAYTQYAGERGEDYWETETFTDANGRMETRQVMRTRWWPASGAVNNHFDDLLVMASKSLPPKQAAHLEPWDLKNLVAYADEYLAGFAAESYQVDLPQGFAQAQQLAEPAIRRSIERNIGGDHQRILSMQSAYSAVTFKHILLPMWISAYSYAGKSYRFLINARTGAVQGERPYSAWKIAALVMAILAAIVIFILLKQR
jgi:DNA-directed RNA polymerase subunit RPC12/RpoP